MIHEFYSWEQYHSLWHVFHRIWDFLDAWEPPGIYLRILSTNPPTLMFQQVQFYEPEDKGSMWSGGNRQYSTVRPRSGSGGSGGGGHGRRGQLGGEEHRRRSKSHHEISDNSNEHQATSEEHNNDHQKKQRHHGLLNNSTAVHEGELLIIQYSILKSNVNTFQVCCFTKYYS